jgi:hypothetical protein
VSGPDQAPRIERIEASGQKLADWVVVARPTFRRAGLSLTRCTRYVRAGGARTVVWVAVSRPLRKRASVGGPRDLQD